MATSYSISKKVIETIKSVKSDYCWYEIGDIVSIGTNDFLYFCFPKEGDIVAKTRLAAEELYKLSKGKTSSEKENE